MSRNRNGENMIKYCWICLILSSLLNIAFAFVLFEIDGQKFAYREAFNASRSTLEGYLRTQGRGINSSFTCRDKQ